MTTFSMADEVPEPGGWLVNVFLLILSLHVKSGLYCGALWFLSHLYSRRFLERIRLEKTTVLKKSSRAMVFMKTKQENRIHLCVLPTPDFHIFF